jgi:short-subunit dehydrogenase
MINDYATAIVTGASRGVGPFIAKSLAKEGMSLVLAARDPAGLERVASEVRALGQRVCTVPTDITDTSALMNLVTVSEREIGAIDVLINNAAVESSMFFHKERLETIAQIIATNLTAPMLLSRLVLPGMLQRKRGHIVNMASLVARIPLPYSVVYAASKAGLAHFTASLRAECRGGGVSASTILAGQFTDTGLSAQGLAEAGVIKPRSVPTSPPEAAGAAVIRAIKRDLPEIAIPGPALLFTRIPALGTLFFTTTGITSMVKQIAEARGRSRE